MPCISPDSFTHQQEDDMNMFKASLLSATLLAVTGCASIMHGTTQSVGISSSPSGASVSVDGQNFGTTPAFADLSRNGTHIVSISLPGYRTQDLTLTKSVSDWVWGNIVFGGIIGLAVDAATGGLYKLSPEQMVASLDENEVAVLEENNNSIVVQIVLEPNKEWTKIGSLKSSEIQQSRID